MSNFCVWFCPECDAVLLFDENMVGRANTGLVEKRVGEQKPHVRCMICSSDMHRVPEAALAAFDALKEQRRRAATERLGSR